MLKISVVESPRRCRLVLEGSLVEPWVGELLREYTKAKEHLDGRELVVDLTNLTAMSGAGEDAHPGTDGRSCQIPVWHFCEGSLKKTRVKATATMNIGTTMLSIIKTINAAIISLCSVNI